MLLVLIIIHHQPYTQYRCSKISVELFLLVLLLVLLLRNIVIDNNDDNNDVHDNYNNVITITVQCCFVFLASNASINSRHLHAVRRL